jgi:hypothetical protein
MATTRPDDQRHDWMRYPTGYLAAIIEDAQGAEQAAQALREAGFADIEVFQGQQALQAIEADEHKASPLRRAWERLERELSDETDDRREALDALRRGHAVVMVYAPMRSQADQAVGILRAHRAHPKKFFGRWVITDLSS